MRTEKKLQAVDSWCARRTLQTWLYLNAMILRHIRASLGDLVADFPDQWIEFLGFILDPLEYQFKHLL